MKLFLKADVDQAEIIPRARFSYIRVTDGARVLNRMFIVRTPFRGWIAEQDPWMNRPFMGFATYTFAIFHLPANRKLSFSSKWEPIESNNWM
jgi:hypothetical protein